MLGNVVEHILEHHLGGVAPHGTEIVCYVGERVGLNLHVGLNAAAVAHFPSASGIEHLGERVGDMLGISATRVLVVYRLDAAPAGDVILSGGKFQVGVIRQVERCLHQSLAVGARAHNHSTVEVLQRARRNLTCRCRVIIDEHHYRHVGVYRFLCRFILAVRAVQFAFRCHQREVVCHEHVHYLHSLLERTATIVAKVENKTFHALFLQVNKGATHLLSTVLSERVQIDVAIVALHHSIVRDGRHLYRAAGDFLRDRLAVATLYLKRKGGARVATQVTADIRHVLAHHRRVVDAQDDVALLQSSLSGWRVGVRLVNHHTLEFRVIAYQSAYSGIFTGNHHLQVLDIRRRVIHRVRVERAQHGVYSRANHLIGIQRIHIHHVEVAVNGIENVNVLCHVEVMVAVLLGKTCARDKQRRRHHEAPHGEGKS